MSYETPIDINYPSTRTLTGKYNLQTAMPLGGIGAGSICFNGQGGLQDFSIRHLPDISALPGHDEWLVDAGSAILHVEDESLSRRTLVVEAPCPKDKLYAFGTQAKGYHRSGFIGMPHFEQAEFQGNYPFGQVRLKDGRFPLSVVVTAWSPFIPGDDEASGAPAAILEYHITNESDREQTFQFSYHLSHLAQRRENEGGLTSCNRIIPGRGIFFYNKEDPLCDHFGSASLVSLSKGPEIKAMWFRGIWFDSVSMLWNEISQGRFETNAGAGADKCVGRNGGSILFRSTLGPGETASFPIAITWHFPNSHYYYGPEPNIVEDRSEPWWRPWYAGRWKDAGAVADFLIKNGPQLRARTVAFHQALMSSTLPPEVLDAVSANLGILKSPTVLRLENGDFWAWEGSGVSYGSCEGCCTHVWNYAQALAHLFPKLERSMREQEYEHNMNESGHVNFRFSIPRTMETRHDFHPAADGQLGGIIKLYRDWQISGDRAWLERLLPLARKSLDFCIRTWDPDECGIMSQPHHNTYDIEFHGPDGMCGSIYVAALAAMAEMCHATENTKEAAYYRNLSERAARYLDEHLFNGEYYEQTVSREECMGLGYRGVDSELPPDPAYAEILQREGPKYQYGEGCLSDGIIGAWFAFAAGLQAPFNAQYVCDTLTAIHRYNFKPDLRDHVNLQRPGYAAGGEGGLILCTWPRGGRPSLPFVYADEVWTGIEYQVASHLISTGLLNEGLEVVRAARARYDGYIRNPWNEYECGNYYARAMASYALLQAYSGLRYSSVTQTLFFAPCSKTRPFTCFLAIESGFGTVTLDERGIRLCWSEGSIEIGELAFTDCGEGQTKSYSVDRVVEAQSDVFLAHF